MYKIHLIKIETGNSVCKTKNSAMGVYAKKAFLVAANQCKKCKKIVQNEETNQ